MQMHRKIFGGVNCADELPTTRLEDINKHCLNEFRYHWQCLEDNNQQLWQCRKPERSLNKCVFDNLVRPSMFNRPIRMPPAGKARRTLLMSSAEAGEEHSRHAPGRDPSPPAQEADLRTQCDAYVKLLEKCRLLVT